MHHGVKALIYRSNRRVLLQQRDCSPGLTFPSHWTFFGGRVEPGESFARALERELVEELGCLPGRVGEELFDWIWTGIDPAHNHCFPVRCEVADDALELCEGQAMSWFSYEQLQGLLIVPGLSKQLPKIGAFLGTLAPFSDRTEERTMTHRRTTVEPQYQFHVEHKERHGLTPLGIEKSAAWRSDPRRILFCLSRYKFVAKMLSGMNRVLEVGCGDGWPIPIVLQEVKYVHGIDIDPVFIDDMKERIDPSYSYSFGVHDMLDGPLEPAFDAVYSLDVLEHIQPGNDEHRFLRNVVASLTTKGVAIIGTPSLQSQPYASPSSKAGHVNCKDAPDLKRLLEKYFDHVFMFSMNDEVVHTGYHPMAQYLFALCSGVRQDYSQ